VRVPNGEGEEQELARKRVSRVNQPRSLTTTWRSPCRQVRSGRVASIEQHNEQQQASQETTGQRQSGGYLMWRTLQLSIDPISRRAVVTVGSRPPRWCWTPQSGILHLADERLAIRYLVEGHDGGGKPRTRTPPNPCIGPLRPRTRVRTSYGG
jgi:hypothetical protein